MNYQKLSLGLGAFALGAAGLVASAVFGERLLRGREGQGDSPPATDKTDDSLAPADQTLLTPTLARGQMQGGHAAPLATSGADTPAGHVPTDLMADHQPGPNDRAPDAFRPDLTAPVPDSEREALRPATMPLHVGLSTG